MSDPIEPLTPEEQAQRDQLNYQQAMIDWQARETDRETRLAALAPVADALGTKDEIEQTVAALQQLVQVLGYEDAASAQRLAWIMRSDATKLANLHEQLQVPEPEPVAPEAAA